MSSKKPLSAIIVGAGHRAMFYSEYAVAHPDRLQIVGVADPDRDRCVNVMKKFGFSEDRIFASADELAAVPRFADAVINGTMDQQHIATAVPLLEKGYDMLLEKPFACNLKELEILTDTIKKHGNKVMICHVLRYTPFYRGIKEHLLSGDIGDIINMQMTECVSYHHLSTSYVRGKWGNSDKCGTTMLLAKCCHDLDIMMWLMGEDKPTRLNSYGSLMQFKPENAPQDSTDYCLLGCPHVDTCLFSAKRLYLDHPDRWEFYVWSALENMENPTMEDRIELLKSSPYGRCMYKCGNNVVDHQSVLVEFKSGATVTHNMVGGSSRPLRRIHIIGTRGEILGDFEKGIYSVLKINPDPDKEYDIETFDTNSPETTIGHGGGDMELMRDFVDFIVDDIRSVSCTSIENSIAGHLAVFLADESRLDGGASKEVNIKQYL